MVTTQSKELAAAREKPAQPERTVATELPQELSRLREQNECSDVNSSLKGGKSAAHGGGRKKAGRPKQAAAGPKTRKRAVTTTTGFTDDGHPTILAATPGLIHPSWIIPRH
jgi:hypothetical protein